MEQQERGNAKGMRTVEFEALPDYMRDNEYITGHYRLEWPLKHTLLSIFTIHNETLNVWTHLLGFIFFLCLTIYTATKLPNVSDLPVPSKANLHRLQSDVYSSLPSLPNMAELQAELRTALPNWVGNCLPENSTSHSNGTVHCIFQTIKDDVANMVYPHSQRPITRWPFFVFLGGATFCLLASTSFHWLCCHSERLYMIFLRLDYSGIAALIAASFYPPVYYSFMCTPYLRNMYLTAITLLGIATIIVSLFPAFQNPKYRSCRAILFSGMAIWGIAPVVHKVILHKDQPEALHTTAYEIGMGCFYVLGVLVYATRIPERWKPGKFDIAGHSHQLFHILVIAGAYTHYQAGLLYLKWRDLKGC
ncbi:hypothetical protein SUGI_0733200 [Cryptomeria japonica]|uniref:heptahelical transmembrane protein ADIPOR3 n=1 Tax=Cryptomeria japonica TaxID=3369 RepID=UPI00241488B2|nr:heptahelical transmembrane protein ADIPOR3 [Cryptomeria japonica]GLJ36499.1 hypothetical protein SUGI_0733200 [Cryptomeria japonica]